MGFAFEDGTGLPMIVDPANPGGWQPPPPVSLQPEPAPAPSPEVAIGDIMVRVQRFADETAEEAQQRDCQRSGGSGIDRRASPAGG
jgi:hypothetical protein